MPQVDAEQGYWREISTIDVLSRQEELALFARYRAGDCTARNALIRSNLRFVISVARQYAGRGLTLDELVSEGTEGLIYAVERFDETRGFKLITYAVNWIRQRILMALSHQRLTDVPISQVNDLRKVSKARIAWMQQHGGVPPSRADLCQMARLTPGRLDNVLRLETYHEASLDGPVCGSDPKSPSCLERLTDTAPDVLHGLERRHLLGRLNTHMATLEPRQRHILACYFGLEGEEPATLEEIGRMFGVTRERIRQLRNKSLEHLRAQLTPEEQEALLGALHTEVFA